MFYLISLLLILISLTFLWVKKRYRYWSDNGFKQLNPEFPFGDLRGVGSELTIHDAMDRHYKQFKGKATVGGIYFFLAPAILAIDLEILKHIYIKDFSSFHDRGFYHNKKGDPLSANMLTLDGQEWKDVRSKLSSIFTSGKMKLMFGIVNEIGDKLIKVLRNSVKDNDAVEMRDWLGRYTCDVIGNVAFGIDCNCLEDANSEFRRQGKRLFERKGIEILRFFFTNAFPKLSLKIGIKTTAKEPAKFFMETFINTIKEREDSGIERKDFVQLLLQMKKSKEGKVFTDTELAAESFLFYAGGFETSSTLLTFCLYELALNNDIQEKLRHEIKETLEDNDGILTYENLFGMKYLDMVINESLRKYPPIPNNIRKCTKDFQVPNSNLVIKEGTNIQIPNYSIHHDPEYYPDPEKYDPDRFSEENVKSRHPFAFIPFGEGPRGCVGLRFGLMQSKLCVVKIISSYKISISSKTIIPVKFVPSSPFLTPIGGMWLQLMKV